MIKASKKKMLLFELHEVQTEDVVNFENWWHQYYKDIEGNNNQGLANRDLTFGTDARGLRIYRWIMLSIKSNKISNVSKVVRIRTA